MLGCAMKREGAGQHLVKDDAEGPDVGAGVGVLAAQLLGRHVGDGADGAAGVGQAGLAGDLGQAEVGDADRAVGGEEDVGGLDVAVDDAAGVGSGEAVGGLGDDRQGLGWRERTAADPGAQALAAAEGHGDEHAAVLALADVVDRADVGAVEGRGGPGFVDEALAGLGVVGELGREELEGHGAPELEVVGLVDDAHGAAADLSEDAVFAAGDQGAGAEAALERVDGRGERERLVRRGRVRGGVRLRTRERSRARPAIA